MAVIAALQLERDSAYSKLVDARTTHDEAWRAFGPYRHLSKKHPELAGAYSKARVRRDQLQALVDSLDRKIAHLDEDRSNRVDEIATLIADYPLLQHWRR